MLFIILAVIVLIVAYALLMPEIKHKRTFGKWSWEKSKVKFKTIEVPVLKPQHADELILKYDEQFVENDDYRFKRARMKNEHYGEKVYRYSPAYLPVKVEGHDVYSKLDDWVKVGEIEEEINGKPSLLLYINEYKDVKNIEVRKVKGDPFYVLKVKVDL